MIDQRTLRSWKQTILGTQDGQLEVLSSQTIMERSMEYSNLNMPTDIPIIPGDQRNVSSMENTSVQLNSERNNYSAESDTATRPIKDSRLSAEGPWVAEYEKEIGQQTQSKPNIRNMVKLKKTAEMADREGVSPYKVAKIASSVLLEYGKRILINFAQFNELKTFIVILQALLLKKKRNI